MRFPWSEDLAGMDIGHFCGVFYLAEGSDSAATPESTRIDGAIEFFRVGVYTSTR